jgi:hypothetical protein
MPPEYGALPPFVASRFRARGREPNRLPRWLTHSLWVVFALDLDVAIGMYALAQEKWPCSGHVCTTVTLGGRQSLIAITTLGCALALLLLASFTEGLTRADGSTLALAGLVCVVSVVAAIGIVLVVALIVSFVAALITACSQNSEQRTRVIVLRRRL